MQASLDSHEPPIIGIEDLWQSVQGPTSLVELAVEQKEANIDLVIHHHSLCIVLVASLTFSLKSIKPLSLFGKKVWDTQFMMKTYKKFYTYII